MVAHVHHADDEVPDGAVKVVAELADLACADTIFEATAGLPPVAAVGEQRRALRSRRSVRIRSRGARRPHAGQSARADPFDGRVRARSCGGRVALIVNLLDSKLAAPNPDFLSYTLSKQALAGFTELAARALATKGIRVNGIAPALDPAIARPERGEFRAHAYAQPASPRRGSRRYRRRDPLSVSAGR